MTPSKEEHMTDVVSFYKLERVDIEPPKPGEFWIATAGVMSCGLCGETIDGMGGPGEYICIRCGDVVKDGHARGAIKWGAT